METSGQARIARFTRDRIGRHPGCFRGARRGRSPCQLRPHRRADQQRGLRHHGFMRDGDAGAGATAIGREFLWRCAHESRGAANNETPGKRLLLHVSGARRLAIPGMGLYCASKFAMEALAETYRYELASQGIDSVILQPGAYMRAIADKLEAGEDPERRTGHGEMAQGPSKILQRIRSSRANPQEIAHKVLEIILTPSAQRNLRYRSEEHTSELQSRFDLVCRLLLEKKKNQKT